MERGEVPACACAHLRRRQVHAVVVAQVVVGDDGGGLDAGAHQEVHQHRLHLGLTALEVVAAFRRAETEIRGRQWPVAAGAQKGVQCRHLLAAAGCSSRGKCRGGPEPAEQHQRHGGTAAATGGAPMSTFFSTARSIRPGTKVFWGEPLMKGTPSSTQAAAYRVEGDTSAGGGGGDRCSQWTLGSQT